MAGVERRQAGLRPVFELVPCPCPCLVSVLLSVLGSRSGLVMRDPRDPLADAQPLALRCRQTIVQRPSGKFDHHRLDAFHVARDALRLGDAIARRLPHGYTNLSDQLRRALLAAYLGIAEASGRLGQDRLARFRCARGEAAEAAAAEAVQVLALAPAEQTQAVLDLCDRLCAMLTRLSGAATASKSPVAPATRDPLPAESRPPGRTRARTRARARTRTRLRAPTRTALRPAT